MSVETMIDNDDATQTAVASSRVWPRFPSAMSEISVIARGEKRKAEVVDESFGGIGIVMEDASGILRETEILVELPGTCWLGVVRWSGQLANGRYRLGIERIEHFVASKRQLLVCQIIDWPAEAKPVVMLRDGTEMQVGIKQLYRRTISQRKAELRKCSWRKLGKLARAYGITNQLWSHHREAITLDILDYEFQILFW